MGPRVQGLEAGTLGLCVFGACGLVPDRIARKHQTTRVAS